MTHETQSEGEPTGLMFDPLVPHLHPPSDFLDSVYNLRPVRNLALEGVPTVP